jgi:hypothetical protein
MKKEDFMKNISKMDRFCVVCEKILDPYTSGCCTPSSLVATQVRGFIFTTRVFYDLKGLPLDDAALWSMTKIEKEKHWQLKQEAKRKRLEDEKRKEEKEQIEVLKLRDVSRLERLLRDKKKESRFSNFLGGYTEDDIFVLQDPELRRKAINLLGDIQTEDAILALKKLMSDQEALRVYSPNADMKHDEIELIRLILGRGRNENIIIIKCPYCKTELDIIPQKKGTKVKCDNCQHEMLAPSDKTPNDWAKRMMDTKDWNGLLEPWSDVSAKQDFFDPWHHDKIQAAHVALKVAGEQVILPLVEFAIQDIQKKGELTCLQGLCTGLYTIMHPSTAPYLNIIMKSEEKKLSVYSSLFSDVKKHVTQHESATCDSDLLRRLGEAYGKKYEEVKLGSRERIGDWLKISGSYATSLAEASRVARPGTFTAVVLCWEGLSEVPFFLTVSGTVTCAYCKTDTNFNLTAIHEQVHCTGCSAIFSLDNFESEFDNKKARIIVASVFSHTQGTPVNVPVIEISTITITE